ncbi:MAG: hypothetical protein WCK63_17825, partial [Betaproteobacteria bacterium]
MTVVLADFVGSSTDVAVMVTVWAVAGAVQALPAQVPALADQLTLLVAPPLTVLLKVVTVLTSRVGAA